MTLSLSLLLRRFYSNTFLAQHSRTTNISMNFIKLASIMGASNLLSRTPSTPFLPGSKTELLSRSFKASLLVASSISFPFPKAVTEKLKMLQASCPESFFCRAASWIRVPVVHSVCKAVQGAGSGHAAPGVTAPSQGRGRCCFLFLCDLFQSCTQVNNSLPGRKAHEGKALLLLCPLQCSWCWLR